MSGSVLPTRRIAQFDVSAIGLGCMNLSHAYGNPPAEPEAARLLLDAVDLGVTLFDTAALYGFGANEELVGRVLSPHRDSFVLASKCGMTGVDGKRVIDGRPDTIVRTCEEALRRLRTDVIDLYYLHRLDRNVPIEESVGALAGLVSAGKIRAIGLSEMSAGTVRRAHAIHPIAALQNEYSLWSRNPELGTLDVCRELGISLVAFSPLARGFLTAAPPDRGSMAANDIRRGMPRFDEQHYPANLHLHRAFARLATEADCTPAQLALAWLLAQDEIVVPIPGTTNPAHLRDDVSAAVVQLPTSVVDAADRLINDRTVSGSRYNPAAAADIDTEAFPQAG